MPRKSRSSPSGVISSTVSDAVGIVLSIHLRGANHQAGHGKRGFGPQIRMRDRGCESCALKHTFDVRLGVAIAAGRLDLKFTALGGRDELLARKHEWAAGTQGAAGPRRDLLQRPE